MKMVLFAASILVACVAAFGLEKETTLTVVNNDNYKDILMEFRE